MCVEKERSSSLNRVGGSGSCQPACPNAIPQHTPIHAETHPSRFYLSSQTRLPVLSTQIYQPCHKCTCYTKSIHQSRLQSMLLSMVLFNNPCACLIFISFKCTVECIWFGPFVQESRKCMPQFKSKVPLNSATVKRTQRYFCYGHPIRHICRFVHHYA